MDSTDVQLRETALGFAMRYHESNHQASAPKPSAPGDIVDTAKVFATFLLEGTSPHDPQTE